MEKIIKAVGLTGLTYCERSYDNDTPISFIVNGVTYNDYDRVSPFVMQAIRNGLITKQEFINGREFITIADDVYLKTIQGGLKIK